jgi:two-component system, chemotaxis family, sensor kinase CheA
VPFVKLDSLLARVGELVSLHARLEGFAHRNRESLHRAGLFRELAERLEDLEALGDSLQDTTMDLRLVPLRTILGRFPALVREIAREQEKQARLVVEGDEIELDKTAVDALGEPLLHLVRNAVDHGLETPAVRGSSGKDPVGTVSIRARREGDHIVVVVADDGAGLDRAAVLRRAREGGLVEGTGTLSDPQIHELLFTPGFSTRDQATTLSGRGVGLDIVRRTVLRLRGSLDVESEESGGARFTLRLPLTLAIVSALVFETDGEMLALPATDIEETLSRSVPERVGGTYVVRRGSAVIPLAPPKRIFAWRNGDTDDAAGPERRFAIVIRKGDRFAAIPADRLIDQRNVVVKALPPLLVPVRGVSGVTIAADGRVVLLLDSQAVLDLNLEAQRREPRGD